MRVHRLQQLDARQAGHHDVADDEVELVRVEKCQRALGGVGTRHVVSRRLEDLHHELADHELVVDHEHGAHCTTSASVASGKRSENVAP